MKSSEIKQGETYLFIATDNPLRKGLVGQPFTVYEIKRVWRRVKKKRANVKRFFNEFGEGARAEELEPLNQEVVEMSITLCIPSENIHIRCEHDTQFTGPKSSIPFDNAPDDLPF
jgi:hypothetical protein